MMVLGAVFDCGLRMTYTTVAVDRGTVEGFPPLPTTPVLNMRGIIEE